MPEDPIDSPPTSDPPPIGGSGISKSIDDTTATTDTMQGYSDPTTTDTTSTSSGDVTDTSTTDTTKAMPESDPPPIGGSGL